MPAVLEQSLNPELPGERIARFDGLWDKAGAALAIPMIGDGLEPI